MSSEHPIVQKMYNYVAAIIVPELIRQRLFPIVDEDGQVVASMTIHIDKFDTKIDMTCADGLRHKNITLNTTQGNYKVALKDAIIRLALSLELDIDNIKILISKGCNLNV